MENKLEVNQFTKEWVEAGRKAGFTDDQLLFLGDFHRCACDQHYCPFD